MGDVLAAVDGLARERLSRWGVPGLVVGVLHGGEKDVRAWGVASVETGEPLGADATFRVASVTKPFTAALARALLDVDAPLETPAGPATPRQLLAHVGGLRCEAARPLWDFPTVSAAVEGAGLRGLAAPGEVWVYSNAGYWVVGAAIERATGRSYEEAMQEHVLAPLGMQATAFEGPTASGHEPVEPGAAEHRPYPIAEYPVPRRPSGGLVSSASDLLRFAARALDDDEIRTSLATRPGGGQGIGWWLDRRGGVDLVLHPGSAAGFQSTLVLVPERRVAVVALANSARGSAAFGRVVDALLGELADVPRWAPELVDVPEDDLAALAGTYRGPDEEAVVEATDGGLTVTASARDPFTDTTVEVPPFVGRPVGPGTFAVLEGEEAGGHFDFPGERFRMGSTLAERAD